MKKITSLVLAAFILFSLASVSSLAENDMNVNVSDGDTVSGIFEFKASGAENIKMSVDGKSIGAGIGKPCFSFKASGLDYGGGNVYYGTETFTELPSASGYSNLEFNPEMLSNGDIKLTYVPASSEFDYLNPTVYGTYNLDDQDISNVCVILPNGETYFPTYTILHYPIENASEFIEKQFTYRPEEIYSIGDGWNSETGLGGTALDTPVYATFVFENLSEIIKQRTGFVAVYDTTALEDGKHKLAVTSEGNVLKEIEFFTDNTGPVINFDMDFGTALFKDSVLQFSAEDVSGEAKIKCDIDGEIYHSGKNMEWVSYGKHLLTLTATDKYGNVSIKCTEFFMCDKADEISSDLKQLITSPVIAENTAEYQYNIGKAQSFTFEYLGSTSENGSVSVLAYNFENKSYEEIGVAISGVKSVFKVENAKFINDGNVKIKVKPNIYVSNSDTVVWITDTQYYSNFQDLNDVYELILNYSVGLYKENKAGYLIHTGDIVDTNSEYDKTKAQQEWQFADKVHEILDEAKMPNGVLAGNHDTNNTPADLSYFKRYFGKGRFSGGIWYGGSLDNNSCHYDLITINGTDYLFMFLSNGIEADARTVAWANAICTAYPQRTVIICTHAYLDISGSYVYNPTAPNTYNHSRANEIMEYIIKPNANIAAVLCGHVHGAARVQRDLGNGRYVWEILSDYQYAETGSGPQHVANGSTLDGEGYLRLVRFGENGEVHQTTYSPLHDDYNYFSEDQDTFTVTLQSVSGKVTLETELAALYFEPVSHFNIIPLFISVAVVIFAILTALALLFVKKRKDQI